MDRSDLSGEVADPLIGTMIGRYRVERKIGQGGMGAVYELLQPAIHKRMALKLLHEEYVDRKEIVQRFFDEARAVNLIGHPSIVDITDFSHLQDGRPFIIMEYLQGESLEEYMDERGALPESEVLEILQQICSALAAAHAKDIVHRDLKPKNVFLVKHPHQPMRVKVLDFGIAKLKDNSTLDEVSQTQTGVVLGTPTYMSPEQAQGNTLAADHRTDIYSLGALLFHMLSGSPPFSGKSFAALIFKHISESPPSLSDLRSDIPFAWTRIVDKALAKDPNDRYQSMNALFEDAKNSAGTVVKADTPATMQSWLLPIALPLAVVVVAAAWWLSRDASSAPSSVGPTLLHTSSSTSAKPPIDISVASGSPEADGGPIEFFDASTPISKDPEPGRNNAKVRGGKGKVRVIADPWAHVFLDGKRVGQTPLNLTIGSGRHKIRLRNDATGATKNHRFTLKKGATHTIRERW